MASLTKVKVHNIDTSVTFVYDPIILTNFGSTQANTDVGFVFNRDGGISSNVALYWNETLDRIVIGYTNATGLPNSNIAISKYANVAADWYFGNLAGGTTNTVWVSANVLPTANAFYNFGSPTQRWNVGYFAATTLDLGGSQISVDPTEGFKFVVGGTGTPTYLASNGLVSGTTLSTSGTLNVGTNATIGGYVNVIGNVLAAGATFNALTVNGNENITGYVNATGNVLAATFNGGQVNLSGLINTAGNILSTGAIHNSLTVNGNHNATGYINTTGNVSGAVGVFGTINTSGLINSTANISASMFSGGQLYVSGLINAGGNLLASTGIFNSLDVNGNTEIGSVTVPGAGHNFIGNIQHSGAGTVWINTPGNLLAAYGQFGQIRSDGLINTSANVMAATGRFGTVLSDGFINTSANVSAALYIGGSVVVSGLINTAANILTSQITVFGNATIGAISTPGVVHSIVGNVQQTGAGTIFYNTPGNIMAAIGRFGQISTDGYINTTANISTAQLNAGQINTTGNVLATSGTFNALTVNGNELVTGYLNVTGNILAATGVFGAINSTGFINTSGNVSAATVIAGTMTTTGTLTAAVVNSTGNILGTGAVLNSLTVNGNESITGYLNVTGNVIANTLEVGAMESSGIIYANSTSAATSTSTGAIITAGGISAAKDSYFAGNLTIEGNLFINGNSTTLNTNNLSISDSLIYLATTNPADSLDIGFIGHFVNPGYQHTGFVRDATDGTWKLFANVVAEPTTTVDFTNATYSNLLIGNLLARQITVTGLNSAGFINTSGNVSAAVGLFGSITSTGYINTAGNISTAQLNAGQIVSTGNVSVLNLIASASGQFSGQFNESTTTAGLFVGNTGSGTPSPRVGFFNGTASQNWQIDNYFGSFRWFTPGVTRMVLDPNGNLTVNSATTINYTGNGDSALQIIGPTTKGGAGYHDFLRATNTGGTNPNKWFRINSTGTLEIVNSLYTAVPFSLTDDGRLGISGNVTAGSLTVPGSAHTFEGNVLINGFGAIQVPAGTTLQRPGSTTAGQIRYNTDTNQFEGYGNAWSSIGGGGGGGTPGGVTSTVQYNNGGVFAGIGVMNYILANDAIIMSSGVSSTSTGTGALQIIGGVGITENINVGGYVKVTGLINTAGNVLAATHAGGAVSVTGVGNFGGNILSTGAIHNSLTVNGNIAVGAIGTPGAGHSIVGNVSQTGAGTIFYNTPGNIMALQGSFGSINSTGFINTSGNVSAATLLAGALTSTGFINTSGNISASVGRFGSITSTGFINTSGNVSGAVVLGATMTTTGTLTAAVVNSTGNILGTGGILSTLTVNGTATFNGNTFLNAAGTGYTIFAPSNLDPAGGRANLALHYASGRTIMGWNYSAGRGEFDIICDRDGGSPGGLRIYDWSTANVRIANVLMDINYSEGMTVSGNVLPSASNVYTLGSSTAWWSRIWGVSVNAQYADLAETYSSDRDYLPGTVLVFGGDKEVTISTHSHDPAVAGVVSTNPAYHMNAAAEGIAVALTGRVPTKVKGPVKKGDRLVSSSMQGAAERLSMMHYQPGCIIGKALEDIADDSIQTIEVVVGRV